MKIEGNLINEWLEKYGDIDIEKKIELTLFRKEIERLIKETPNDLDLGQKNKIFCE